MATKTKETIEIKAINIKEAEITIFGESELVTNRFSEKAKQQIRAAQGKEPKVGREKRDPFREYIQSMYWITPMLTIYTEEEMDKAIREGAKFGFPAVGIKESAVSGAYRAGLTKDKVSVYGAFHINPAMIEIISDPPIMREDAVRLGNGSVDLRYRGVFTNWSMIFTIKYNANVYSLEQLVTFIQYGGFGVGIGEWRTEKGGPWGVYRVS